MKRLLIGDIRSDPEGYRVSVGSLAARMFLRKHWAMVAWQTTWLRTEADWRRYLADDHWRAHEHHHYVQERVAFRGVTPVYLLAFVWQYVRFWGHDNAPLEIEAEEAARKYSAAIRTKSEPEGYLRSNAAEDSDHRRTDSNADR